MHECFNEFVIHRKKVCGFVEDFMLYPWAAGMMLNIDHCPGLGS
jgi:hypothetical protein